MAVIGRQMNCDRATGRPHRDFMCGTSADLTCNCGFLSFRNSFPLEHDRMTFADETTTRDQAKSAQMQQRARFTTDFLKSLSHPARLVILCRLAESSATVGELENVLDMPQAAVSKHLARLRDDGLVAYKRDGRSIVYTLADARTRRVIGTLYDEFCV